jgi:hypothetical protein
LISNLTLLWVAGLEIESKATPFAFLFKYVEVNQSSHHSMGLGIALSSGAPMMYLLPIER